MLNLAEYRNHTAGLADFLPWAALAAPGIVLNKDSSFQRTARFRGPDLDSATPAELVGVNASVIFATQSLSDIDGSHIATAIIESCPTRIFLPNERAIEPQITAIYRRFGLNDRQIEIVARATPKRDYYCQSRRGNRLFELGLGPVALAFCAASGKADHAAIARVLTEHGRAAFTEAWLIDHGLVWAADLIPDLTNMSRNNPEIDL